MLSKSERLEKRIMQDILGKKYPEGAAIPSRNRLAEKYMCSRTTVERAISGLSRAGYLIARKGGGTYVRKAAPSNSPLRILWLIASGENVEEWQYSLDMISGSDSGGVPVRQMAYSDLDMKFELLTEPGTAVIWLLPGPENLAEMEYLRKKGIPQLLVNRHYRNFDCVYTDPVASLREGLAWLMIESGRDLALVSRAPSEDCPYVVERQLAFFRLCTEMGAVLHSEFLFDSAGDPMKEIAALGTALFGAPRRPKGICVLNQEFALPLIVSAKTFGIEPGRDFHLLTFDRLAPLDWTPGVGMLDQDYAFFRAEAAHWVASLREGERGTFRIPVKTAFLHKN